MDLRFQRAMKAVALIGWGLIFVTVIVMVFGQLFALGGPLGGHIQCVFYKPGEVGPYPACH